MGKFSIVSPVFPLYSLTCILQRQEPAFVLSLRHSSLSLALNASMQALSVWLKSNSTPFR